jgi:hypothetical protein
VIRKKAGKPMSGEPTLPEEIPDEWLKKFHSIRRLVLARKCYYESRLKRNKRWDQGLKVVLALSSGTVATLAIWKLLFAPVVVNYIGPSAVAITAIIGVLQPIIGLSEKIDESRDLLSTYKRGVDQFDELAFTIERDRLLTFEEVKKIHAANIRGISQNNGPSEADLSRYYSKVVDKTLPKDCWKIAYIPSKETIRTRGA